MLNALLAGAGTLGNTWFSLPSFSRLLSLYLNGAGLSGSLPAAWGQAATPLLQYVDVRWNALTGTLPLLLLLLQGAAG